MTFDYTDCETLDPSPSASDLNLVDMKDFSYSLKAGSTDAPFSTPQFAFVDRSGDSSATVGANRQCFIQFDVPVDLDPTVLFYYKLTNFYQNHRRYVKSLDSDQLKGKHVSAGSLKSGDCKPLAVVDDKVIYPCGLIANSFFNGKYTPQSN